MVDERPPDRNASRLLGRIAQSLNVPLTTFFADKEPAPAIGSSNAAEVDDVAQTAEMLRLFLMLKDLEVRERCLAFVENEVERQN